MQSPRHPSPPGSRPTPGRRPCAPVPGPRPSRPRPPPPRRARPAPGRWAARRHRRCIRQPFARSHNGGGPNPCRSTRSPSGPRPRRWADDRRRRRRTPPQSRASPRPCTGPPRRCRRRCRTRWRRRRAKTPRPRSALANGCSPRPSAPPPRAPTCGCPGRRGGAGPDDRPGCARRPGSSD